MKIEKMPSASAVAMQSAPIRFAKLSPIAETASGPSGFLQPSTPSRQELGRFRKLGRLFLAALVTTTPFLSLKPSGQNVAANEKSNATAVGTSGISPKLPPSKQTQEKADALKAAPRKIALGIYSPDVNAQTLAPIEAIEQAMGKQFPIVHVYTGFREEFDQFAEKTLNPMSRSGSTMMVSWAPGVKKGVLYDEISKGQKDDYIRRWAKGAKAYDKPILLRFAYEMNMGSGGWSATGENGGSEKFIESWRRVVVIFREEGADNVKFVWCPHIGSGSPAYRHFENYYPGNDYVDWIGMDGYHWAVPAEKAEPKPGDSFDWLFRHAYDALKQKNKPLMIAELGTPWTDPDAAKWLTTAFHKIETEYPKIGAVVYFDADFSKRNELDWQFSNKPGGINVFKALAQKTEYQMPTSDIFEKRTSSQVARAE